MKLGLAWTAYLILSFAIFLGLSNTLHAAIAYIFLLAPFYGVIGIIGGAISLKNRHKIPIFNRVIWIIIFILQSLISLTAAGNCYNFKQGSPCYSNLQILIGNAPRFGASDIPHWIIVEHAFFGFLAAYAVALVMGVWSTKFKIRDHNPPTKP
ncbi:hypothetical protein [[Limnothrix rosea] IAM M-220]|uniref:hypothetical protein n=1 Tax=[Limnothrix rosea] IAM M-220 TaxID=454133 RepID=UPI000969C263|nr:hypothetical protein [[Limnothrix rosea] IAM M-220]OKH13783.1 hypothetical protein NIES208_14740 [[Limnothrix rosea] IAM M-220]